jgi:hypothetical protein
MKTAQPLSIDPESFKRWFDRRSFRIEHNLCDEPLFEIDRLVELAQYLPPQEIEYNPGDLAVSHDPNLTPGNGLSPEETVRRIRDCNSWLVLKRVEKHPAYRVILDRCLDQVASYLAPPHDRLFQREGFIFVSWPGSVTPYHMDPEENFLLQIRGKKTMYVWKPDDREVISERQLEQYFASSGHRNLQYQDAYEPRGTAVELSPGQGVHVPMAVPHWVKNGDDVSVSFSITFRTPACTDRELLYQINSRLRGLGLSPRPVGSSRLHDHAKLRIYSAYYRARRLLRSVTPG